MHRGGDVRADRETCGFRAGHYWAEPSDGFLHRRVDVVLRENAYKICNYLNQQSNVDDAEIAIQYTEDKFGSCTEENMEVYNAALNGCIFGFNAAPKGGCSDEDMIAFAKFHAENGVGSYDHSLKQFKAQQPPPLTITISMQGGEIVRDNGEIKYTVNG